MQTLGGEDGFYRLEITGDAFRRIKTYGFAFLMCVFWLYIFKSRYFKKNDFLQNNYL